MKKVILFSILLGLLGCAHYKYEAKEELKKQVIDTLRLSRYDLVIGIQFKDQTPRGTTEAIKGDLASEITNWFVNFLEEDRNFKKVVNLNQSEAPRLQGGASKRNFLIILGGIHPPNPLKRRHSSPCTARGILAEFHKTEEVDVILKGIIKSIRVEEPGISGASKALAIFYGVAPVLEHYTISKQIDSSATVKFQLIEPKTYKLLWNKLITGKVREKMPLSKSSKLIFASITKTVETLLDETEFPEELNKIAQKQRLTVMVATKKEPPKTPIVDTSLQRPTIAQRWAVIVGISNYHDSRIPSLRYADTDARSFYNWLTSPEAGCYPPSRVKLMVNEQATGHNIREALFVWLKQAIEEDMVLIFFACHGSHESPDSPDNLFLLPYDVQYDNIAITGFPMWDIETALKRFVKAKKVVVIADACHSGGVGQAFDVARRANRGIKINPISSGLQNLSIIGDGVAVISASDDTQFSQESEKWGGGHGAFTYFLLKGLKGEADYNKDNRVTLGELIPYLSEQVRRETRNAQSPTVAGKFDPALSIGR